MRKLLLLLLAVTALAAGSTTADVARSTTTASKTVRITHTGYKPTSVSITVGDTVVFTNADTAGHTVRFNPTTGIHCSGAIPLVIQPGQSASCTFQTAGKFNFSDPAQKGKIWRGTVTVTKAAALSLAAAPEIAVYGRKVTLSGALASQQAGESLQIFAQQCGEATSTRMATVTTTNGGAFSYQAQPLKNTTYTVKFKSLTSRGATVKVRPRLRLRKIAAQRYSLRVFAAQSFAGKYATFQRYRPVLRRWVAVKRVLLRPSAAGVAPTVIAAAKFRSRVKAGMRVRVVLGQRQVGSCYLTGRSNTIRS